MYLRPCYRMKDGKRHAYWALVESYRTGRGPRQRRLCRNHGIEHRERYRRPHASQQGPARYVLSGDDHLPPPLLP